MFKARACAILAGLLLSAGILRADVKPAVLFADHMVLQQGMPVPVWGLADPGERVTVTVAGQSASATAQPDGKWLVRLQNLTSADTPITMTIAGKNTVTINDVLVGEVWLASGQSNMDFSVSSNTQKYGRLAKSFAGVTNEEQEIAAANYPLIRMFTGQSVTRAEPQTSVPGEWKVCSPETVPGFSAVGYMFARDLQQALKVPVGIVTMSYGASTAEAWMSRESLASDPKLKFMLDRFDTIVAFYKEHPDVPGAEAPKRIRTINKGVVRPPAVQTDPVRDQHCPTVLFNGMIAPIIPYAIKGVIWYQGESICYGTPGVQMYGDVQKALVLDWRKQWQRPDLPFYIVQLPGQQNISNHPLIREQQQRVLELPNTGMAVTIDSGEAKNVHPHNKAPVADRLTKLALAGAYGKPVEAQSPMYGSMSVEGDTIRIKLKNADSGLAARGGPLKGFAIAGEDKNFIPAEAKIDGSSIVVSAPGVSSPVAVRYAWEMYPEGTGCNLYSTAGLPAAPFRTDTWPVEIEGITED